MSIITLKDKLRILSDNEIVYMYCKVGDIVIHNISFYMGTTDYTLRCASTVGGEPLSTTMLKGSKVLFELEDKNSYLLLTASKNTTLTVDEYIVLSYINTLFYGDKLLTTKIDYCSFDRNKMRSAKRKDNEVKANGTNYFITEVNNNHTSITNSSNDNEIIIRNNMPVALLVDDLDFGNISELYSVAWCVLKYEPKDFLLVTQ